MRVGLVAEGRGDLAVLVNLLKGALGLDFEDIQFIRPEYDLDETDIHNQPEAQRGGWARVKRECQERTRIREFVANVIEDEFLVVVQIDTAEAHDQGYDVSRPARDAGAALLLRERVIEKIEGWLEHEFRAHVRYAVAVEETEAWVLTIFSTTETSGCGDPKAQLNKQLNRIMSEKERKQHFQRKEYEQARTLTLPFRKARELEKCASRNASLQAFLDSLTGK